MAPLSHAQTAARGRDRPGSGDSAASARAGKLNADDMDSSPKKVADAIESPAGAQFTHQEKTGAFQLTPLAR
jgi:hypothetical protein